MQCFDVRHFLCELNNIYATRKRHSGLSHVKYPHNVLINFVLTFNYFWFLVGRFSGPDLSSDHVYLRITIRKLYFHRKYESFCKCQHSIFLYKFYFLHRLFFMDLNSFVRLLDLDDMTSGVKMSRFTIFICILKT